ncbi:hypothetical protein VE01_02603 [Pseudogymnoascus verrucosus]|uniref:HMG box domain-containing protein n=1 Tax=Pseudogymnoascus verrucosus TaxID=342668 RepID=A0A1B8GTJ5_9PEZI|nr:uncharacterized protein VE01_02603 [Pseudogymnoascus verrucosus]OBT99156.1 hypothetical protein VE01_02603 [Pseudogymnoascus verrucosus]
MSLHTTDMNFTPTNLAQSISAILSGQITGNNVIAHIQLSGIFDQLEQNEKNWLLYGFALLINSSSEFTVLNDLDRVVFHPFGQGPQFGQGIFYSPDTSASEPTGETMAKVPRPPNAFILYRKDHHQLVKDANPGIHNNEISVILGQKWNGESTEVRDHYLALSKQAKRDHLLQYPDYQYRPRRPEQLKRRMTKEKKRKLMARFVAEENTADDNQGGNLSNDASDLKFLIPKTGSPNVLFLGAYSPAKIELAKSVVNSAAMDIDIVSWNSITADVDLMLKDDTRVKDGRIPTTGVAPGAYLWTR